VAIFLLLTAVFQSGEVGVPLRDVVLLLSALVALNTLVPLAVATYRRTLGRRRDRYKRLSRLGTGAQLNFFEAVLGEPPAIQRTVTGKAYIDGDPDDGPLEVDKDYLESIFLDRFFFVQTISNDDETVVAFSITTRAKRFNPVFTGVPDPPWRQRLWLTLRFGRRPARLFRVKLGQTPFAELDDPIFVQPWVGVRAASYSEGHYYGNPGYYQHYVFTASVVGYPPPGGPLLETAQFLGHREWPYPDDSPDASPLLRDIPGLSEFRRTSAITTYSVLGDLSPAHFPRTSYGPHGDDVRTLP
jgi:hypothetical protein